MSSAKKREREDDELSNIKLGDTDTQNSSGPGGTSSNFRNVSACNRCRHRKNRCDQRLPQCSACLKVNAQCVGFDPVSKREIPRSYVYFLETRVINLERLLQQHGIAVPAPEESFPISAEVKPGVNVPFPPLDEDPNDKSAKHAASGKALEAAIDPALRRTQTGRSRAKSGLGKVSSAMPTPDLRKTLPQKTMQPPGISFSKVVFAAVRSTVTQTASEKGDAKASGTPARKNSAHGTQDCFFGLVTRPTATVASWPEYEVGLRLVQLYFEHANPQIPILHRGEFMSLFEHVYAKPASDRTSREMYLMMIVFAIGSGIIMDGSSGGKKTSSTTEADAAPDQKRPRLVNHQCQPEEYHAAAMTHLEHFLTTPTAMDAHGGGMEELQAVLLSAALALLRPIAPGLWYIIGVAVRLAVDLGLHFEDADPELDTLDDISLDANAMLRVGKKQWKRDLRRRLWWCVYSFDRLVSTCVGRPFGITDQVVTTEFPSLLDDAYITKDGFTVAELATEPRQTYKLVSHHYFRLRLLQSEILQVLQYRQAQNARMLGANAGNVYMHTRLPSPFLQRFSSFREWRADVDRKLGEWKDGAPSQTQIGVAFTPLFLELNYWQAIIMLYRQSLAVPAPLAEELSASTGEHVSSPGTINHELQQDEHLVFLKVAQAGQMVIKTYRQLHRLKLVNYTFLATHHLFMSGISFLYALWHSPLVRSQLTLDDVDFTILAATSILGDLINNCPPAEACRDAFQRMSRATIGLCMSTTGFGSVSSLGSQPVATPGGDWTDSHTLSAQSPDNTGAGYFSPQSVSGQSGRSASQSQPRKMLPRFDMNLNSLFSDEELTIRPSLAPIVQQATSPGLHSPPLQGPSAVDIPGSYKLSNKSPYAPLATSINAAQPELKFDKLDFLDSFVIDDPSQPSWMDGFELDLGFGTGGTAGVQDFETGGQMHFGADGADAQNGGVDLFDGFFFGS